MTTREGETMNLNDPNSIRETVFAIARDGARPHIKAGIVKRLRGIHRGLVTLETVTESRAGVVLHDLARRLEAEIATLEELT